MKLNTLAIAVVTVLVAGPAAADWKDDVFTDVSRTAPRSSIVVPMAGAERTVFDDLRDQAPVKAPDRVDDGFAGE